MNREQIQIIIPVYKSEKFIERCLKSIINQTYTDYVVYMVDDCSPDNSAEICNKYCAQDERFKLISAPKNGGAGHARNIGLDSADLENGYIAFIDSDDYLHPQYLEHLYKLLKDNDADFSWVSVHNTFEKNALEFENVDFDTEYTYTISGHDLLLREDLRVMYLMVWGKLFKSSLWNDIRFDESYKYYEDGATTYKVIYKAKNVVVSDIKLYNYFYSDNSATRSDISKIRILDGIRTETDKIDFYQANNEEDLMDMAYIAYLNTLLAAIRNGAGMGDDGRQIRRDARMQYRKSYLKALKNNNISKKQKIKYIVYRFFPDLQRLNIYLKGKLHRF